MIKEFHKIDMNVSKYLSVYAMMLIKFYIKDWFLLVSEKIG